MENESATSTNPLRLGEKEPVLDRLALLRKLFGEIADGCFPAGSDAANYVLNGGSLRQCLGEITKLDQPTELESKISDCRHEFMNAVLIHPTLHNRLVRKKLVQETEEKYVESIIAYLSAVLDSNTAEEALNVRQLPSIVRKVNVEDDLQIKGFAANHLFVLQDIALREHVARRSTIDEHRRQSIFRRTLGNRTVRLALAGSTFAAAFIPELGFLPRPEDILSNEVDIGLKTLSAAIFGIDAPEAIRLKYLDLSHHKRTRQLNRKLASDKETADLALRTVYSSSRYGSSKPNQNVTDRFGTDDPAENLRRILQLDNEFSILRDDPGGKPYSAEQSLGYAARFLLERREQIDKILGPSVNPDQRKQLFLDFCREIIEEDLARMKKGLTVTRFRKELMKTIGVIPAAIFPDFFSMASEAKTLSREVSTNLQDNDVQP